MGVPKIAIQIKHRSHDIPRIDAVDAAAKPLLGRLNPRPEAVFFGPRQWHFINRRDLGQGRTGAHGTPPENLQGKPLPRGKRCLPPSVAYNNASDASHDRFLLREIEQTRRMLFQAKDAARLGQNGFQLLKTRSPHIAITRVVRSAFGVVPVRNHHEIEAETRQNVEAGTPVQVLAHLVDLINRQRVPSHGQRGGTGSHKAPAPLDNLREDLRNRRFPPLLHRIRGTARTDEDIVRPPQSLIGLLRGERIHGRFGLERHNRHRMSNSLIKKGHRALRQVIRIQLKACGSIQKDGSRPFLHLSQELLVNFNHGGGQLARPHQRDHSPL